MREHSRDRGRLEDMLKFAQNVNLIVSGISFEDISEITGLTAEEIEAL